MLERYNRTAVVLHWAMAIFIITMIVMGWYMDDLPKGSEQRSYFFSLHKSLGLSMALLIVFRIFWRLTYAPPTLPNAIARIPQILSAAAHHLLYLLLVLQPLTGYISSSFSGYKTKFWGLPLPHWGWKNPQLNEFFTSIHEICGTALAVVIGLHVLGVLWHLCYDQVNLLNRMWFAKK